jgi:phosphate transport system protein
MIIRSQFEEKLNELHHQLLMLGLMAEEAVQKSMKSLVDKDVKLAQSVIEGDKAVNDGEVAVEEACFRLIALQQPVGTDLRKIATALKVSTDLERIADHAVSIAKTTIHLKDDIYAKPLIDIPKMGQLVQTMIRDALEAYIQMNTEAAKRIAARDDEIDALFRSIFTELVDLMNQEKAVISQAAHLLFAAQFLERIGDYVTNICEWIIYMSEGRMVELNN